ncbi:MAG: glycosyltransferase family 1 protein [Desulfuromonadales bacterium]
MKIGLNAIGFNPGIIGGVETYFRQLLNHLQTEDGGHEYTITCKNINIDCFKLYNPRFSTKMYRFGRPSFRWLLRGVLFEVLHVDIITPLMNRMLVDVLHHPFSVIEPLGVNIPSVMTFWDMQHEFFPEFFTRSELRFRNYAFRASAQKANRIIVSSEFSKACLIERYNVNVDKIDIIYTGYGGDFRLINNEVELEVIKANYKLPDSFIYYPAALWPHKNHRALLDAVCLVRKKFGLKVNLVLSGMSVGRAGNLNSEIKKHNLEDNVTVLGYIPYGDLPYIYNLATMMIFPSLFEGFGIPLVEAMACGCPVVCSNTTSLPEVVGENNALLFDPQSIEEMATAIEKVWDDRDLRDKMRLAGLKRAELFDWRETARKTRAVYEKACG